VPFNPLPILTALAAVALGYALARAVPARWACPRCHHATAPLRTPWLRWTGSPFEYRWCARCQWSGLSRRRNWIPRPPPPRSAEASDFAWGSPASEDFTWGRGEEAPTSSDAPATRGPLAERPSPEVPGFSWAGRQGGGENSDTIPSPDTFAWGGDTGTSPSFRWGNAPAGKEPPPFQWRDDEQGKADRADPPDTPPAQGFRWGS